MSSVISALQALPGAVLRCRELAVSSASADGIVPPEPVDLEAKLLALGADHRRVMAAPLEIGIPRRHADPALRTDLRILDLPGLNAAGPRELRTARELTASFAPIMSLIIFVQHASHMADAMQDEAITANPHLAAWPDDPDRYRIVFTQSFGNESVKQLLRAKFGPAPWNSQAVAAWMRAHVTGQIGRPAPHAEPGRIERIVFPVEIGDTLSNQRDGDPGYAACFLPANELILAQLRDSLAERASEDGRYLSAPSLATHIRTMINRQRARRAQELKVIEDECAAAREKLTDAERQLKIVRERLAQARHRHESVSAAAAALAASKPVPQRPPRPPMDNRAVVDAQRDDRDALYRSAVALWESWRGAAGRPDEFPVAQPTGLETRVSKKYADRVSCCGGCSKHWLVRSFSDVAGRPEHCYQKMTAAFEETRDWIPAVLAENVAATVADAARRFTRAGHEHGNAERLCAERRAILHGRGRGSTRWCTASPTARSRRSGHSWQRNSRSSRRR